MKKYLLAILILLLLAITLIPIDCLLLEHYQTNEILFVFKVSPGDEFIMKWIHSVELTPWEEIFRIDENNEMILDRTRFQQFGAGVPDYAGTKTEIIDGYIIFSGIDQKVDLLPYGISAFAQHTFIFKDVSYELYKMVKDGDRINFYTDQMSLFQFIRMKYFEEIF